jgi:hypothetical protein
MHSLKFIMRPSFPYILYERSLFILTNSGRPKTNVIIFNIWRSWIRASWYYYKNNQQDALYRFIYYSKSALHVSGDVFAHHQENLIVFTVSGGVHPSCYRLVSRMSAHMGSISLWIYFAASIFFAHKKRKTPRCSIVVHVFRGADIL